jgi:hypothetical protein
VRTAHFKPDFVETFPDPLETGVFYISLEYNTCAHQCACGCGAEVVTPLSPAQWSFTYDGENITVHPSIGNWGLDCGSHYVVSRGRVHWAAQFSRAEIARNRSRDRAALEAHAAPDVDAKPQRTAQRATPAATSRSRWRARLARWLRRYRSRDTDGAAKG